ncbi:MAG: KpsF/GutQ family sugar-phosphate isomerase [Candidatus Omnitrophica bacterium]|nr:KpsF/GutQ family sugar-phosphate isomerase [Candidatus Omnitrophota bacterium]
MKNGVLRRARAVLKIERDAIDRLARRVDHRFEEAVDLLSGCLGRVVVTGMGKPGIIGQKLSATLSSLGAPSLWLHPAEAAHGDLGRVTAQDVVIILSHSGETDEILHLLPVLKRIGSKLIVVTGNRNSRLSRQADVVLATGVTEEASPWGLVPTASTTAMLALGDALAVALSEKRGFTPKDFAVLHPGGSLGKRLTLKVEDLMRTGRNNPVVRESSTVKQVLLAITRARAGSASVVDRGGRLVGIFTDGDLRRHAERDPQILRRSVRRAMTPNPKRLPVGHLAVEALKLLKVYRIDEIPIVDSKDRPVGLLDIQDLLKAGLV